jgi:hypothetical protein
LGMTNVMGYNCVMFDRECPARGRGTTGHSLLNRDLSGFSGGFPA